MIGVLVADDQKSVGHGFAAALNARPDITVVGTAADGAEAVRPARESRPDVALGEVSSGHGR
ncbi:hypothetical protein ABZ260_00050 [Streptosporangium sp. NPDC006013]|uniref:response regulator transcription factor n=1 Tax=Streptosporangium sp. NPDC006013 TaxID=3155596 RepID=UPI0033BCCB27